jgi:hypothetical protein
MQTTILAALITALVTGGVQFAWNEVSASATVEYWRLYVIGASAQHDQLLECQAKISK